MTNNTIPNVPRELLERAWRALANSATGREIGAYLDADPCAPGCAETCVRASMCAACSADLSAPSPAGVDGLEVEAYLHTMHMEIGQTRQFCSKWKGDPFGVSGVDYSSAYSVTSEPLCRLSDAQAIIDGLRGEVERYKTMSDNYCAIGMDANQRIGELEGLLRHAQKQVPAGSGLHMRIDSALSAGKEG